METLDLVNVSLYLNDNEDYIKIDKYYIYPQKTHIYTITNRHQKNAKVEFEGEQENSIIFSGGIYGDNPRKLIEDILVIGSLLTGSNWGLFERINNPDFPLTSRSNLANLYLSGKEEIEQSFQKALNEIMNESWQIQYENGFHLRMLLNHSNITIPESRFLSNMVIWEWLYPHLKNPQGATPDDESDDLKEILDYVLHNFWKDKEIFIGNNLFHALRNQLAHSGKLPINRRRNYVDNWMTKLIWEAKDDEQGIEDYIYFFDKLTQIIVLKTLGIDAERITNNLNKYLLTGKI